MGSSCRFGCRLGCHLGSRFGCTLGGFGTRFGSFGGMLGSRFRFCPFNTQSRHSSHWVFIHAIVGVHGPCFRWQKHLPNLIHHQHPLLTLSQCRTHCRCLLQHHLGDHYQQMSAMTHQDPLQSVRHGDDSPDPDPEVPVPSLSLSDELASLHTPRALFAHTITVSDALSHFLAKAKHMFLVTMTRLFLPASIHAQSFCSISWYLIFLPNPSLKL